MAGVKNFRQLADVEEQGFGAFNSFRKFPTQATAAGIWFDFSMSPGNPNPQYYASAPMVGKAMSYSGDGGLVHGGNVAPKKKYLRNITLLQNNAATAHPMPMMLLDYLYYYPFVDEGVTDVQTLDNTAPKLRYVDGAGVKIMPVVVAGQTGGIYFNVQYTNQDGTSGRVTPNVLLNTQGFTGTIAGSQQAGLNSSGPFMPMQGTDTGVRSIDAVQFVTEDVGLLTFVMVKPLATLMHHGIDAPAERDFALELTSFPEIKDDAYLNLIGCPQGTLATHRLFGTIDTIWS